MQREDRMTATAIGIDIGGTGIKGAVVDVRSGELLTERLKVATPPGGEPDDILNAVRELFAQLGTAAATAPLGVCFPAIIKGGRTMSAANISSAWVGLDAEKRFEDALGRDIRFINDADAAGIGELRFGAAAGVDGLVLLTTLGTGIGSALLYNGVLVPNSELGHLELGGRNAERWASVSAKERHNMSWQKWAKRLQRYYENLELLFSPDLFVVGGGVSKSHEEFLPLLHLSTPIVPATLRNNAGIIGAASLAAHSAH